ncbi:hypothetical protein [Pseudomonas japonica]|uniref:hypothetical protein n=1 Tax=Pseudomonas japonica TaxID=256466 RepID=UPI0015E41083|nr:hypothetical protein [Pseudomonas japonica]MBA1245436.1 hypothetical protein [Pseudomonas japonica]
MSEKGGVSIPVFECLFNGSESITSFTKEFDRSLYEALPHLYVVCIAKNTGKLKQLVGGFFIKTSYHHNDGYEFTAALHTALITSDTLRQFDSPEYSLLPARLGVLGAEPLSEGEMLKIFSQQYLKFNTAAGNA